MQAGFKSSTGKVTHVNFAQAARVRAMDRARASLAYLAIEGRLLAPWAKQAGPEKARRLQLVVQDAIDRDLPTAEAVRNFMNGEPVEAPCEALKAAKRRASLEALL